MSWNYSIINNFFILQRYVLNSFNRILWSPVKHQFMIIWLIVPWRLKGRNTLNFLHWILLSLSMKLEIESEVTTYSNLWLYPDVPLELPGYLPRDYQSKPNSVWVHFLWVLKESEEFEEFLFVFFRNTYACIAYGDVQELFLIHDFDLNNNVDFTFLCELKRIRLKSKENLHDSLLVCFDQRPKLSLLSDVTLWDINESHMEMSVFVLGFPFLNDHHIVNCFHNVE